MLQRPDLSGRTKAAAGLGVNLVLRAKLSGTPCRGLSSPVSPMSRAICFGVVVAALTTAILAQVGQERPGSEPARTMLDTYCAGCHSTAVHAGGLALDTMF